MQTDIEQKALALAVEAAGRRMQDYNIMAEENVLRQSIEAHARAIEQHEAFRQEVSDVCESLLACTNANKRYGASLVLNRFIIAKPDPLVEAVTEADLHQEADEAREEYATYLRAAIEKRGGKIVWGEE